MNAKELHDELRGGGRMWVEGASEDEEDTILRALSLLAAAEANDGTTPETDALVRFEFESTEQPFPAHALLAMIQMAKRLEQERNAALRALDQERRGIEAAQLEGDK